MSSHCDCLGFAVVMFPILIWYYFKRGYKAPVNCFLLWRIIHIWGKKACELVSPLKISIHLSCGQSATFLHIKVTQKKKLLCSGHWGYLWPRMLITREMTERTPALNRPGPSSETNSLGTSWRRHNTLFPYESQQNSIIYPINSFMVSLSARTNTVKQNG